MRGEPDVSLVLVAHHSSAVLPAAVESFRREVAATGLRGEVVVVEQSEDAREVERVAAVCPERQLVLPNRGYAAGINAGCEVARSAVILAGNPDVELAPGALASLLDAVSGGWDVVGPQFRLAGFLFPPADEQSPGAEVSRRRAATSRSSWRRHLLRELGRWRAAWDAAAPVGQSTLSGALLAFRRELWRQAGPWDEDYFLYFEETDWLRRVRRRGGRLALVPGAMALHRWGHSAAPDLWADRFAASRRRYFLRHFPLLGRGALRVPEAPAPAPRPWNEAPAAESWRWLLSPRRHGFPAALLTSGLPLESALGAFMTACGLHEVTLLGWRPEDGELAGPFRRERPTG